MEQDKLDKNLQEYAEEKKYLFQEIMKCSAELHINPSLNIGDESLTIMKQNMAKMGYLMNFLSIFMEKCLKPEELNDTMIDKIEEFCDAVRLQRMELAIEIYKTNFLHIFPFLVNDTVPWINMEDQLDWFNYDH